MAAGLPGHLSPLSLRTDPPPSKFAKLARWRTSFLGCLDVYTCRYMLTCTNGDTNGNKVRLIPDLSPPAPCACLMNGWKPALHFIRHLPVSDGPRSTEIQRLPRKMLPPAGVRGRQQIHMRNGVGCDCDSEGDLRSSDLPQRQCGARRPIRASCDDRAETILRLPVHLRDSDPESLVFVSPRLLARRSCVSRIYQASAPK